MLMQARIVRRTKILIIDSLQSSARVDKKWRGRVTYRARVGVQLEDEFAAEFEFSRILCASHKAEVAVADGIVELIELRVVERVEAVRPKFEAGPLSEGERLVK